MLHYNKPSFRKIDFQKFEDIIKSGNVTQGKYKDSTRSMIHLMQKSIAYNVILYPFDVRTQAQYAGETLNS